MFEIEASVKIPFLWGKAVFKKSQWSQINLIVGPNGSGKTILAQKLKEQFESKGKSVSFIKSDRNNDSCVEILKQNERIRLKIEKVLSSMFGKSISFIEDIDGTFIPIVKNKAWNVEYMLDQVECHGLKEIISLLVCLYSSNTDIIIFDEPELHLHPQFQFFFLDKIRKETKLHPDRQFFLITHSPFFIDVRSCDELKGVIVCHTNSVATHIQELSDEDEYLFKKFLPRFNTYHKQFFFSDNQIFVEGYTDQQMFTYLLPFIQEQDAPAATGVIDVGGKDELGVFCKVCSLLGTNARIITDLDSLFSGKLREVVFTDSRVISWLEKQREKQQTFYSEIFSKKELEKIITLEALTLKLESFLSEIGKETSDSKIEQQPEKIKIWLKKLAALKEKHENPDGVDTYKTVILQGLLILGTDLERVLSKKSFARLTLISNLYSLILAGFEASRVYILPKGCIEHYYTRTSILYMPVSSKDRLFRDELEFITSSRPKTIKKQYADLISILEKAAGR